MDTMLETHVYLLLAMKQTPPHLRPAVMFLVTTAFCFTASGLPLEARLAGRPL